MWWCHCIWKLCKIKVHIKSKHKHGPSEDSKRRNRTLTGWLWLHQRKSKSAIQLVLNVLLVFVLLHTTSSIISVLGFLCPCLSHAVIRHDRVCVVRSEIEILITSPSMIGRHVLLNSHCPCFWTVHYLLNYCRSNYFRPHLRCLLFVPDQVPDLVFLPSSSPAAFAHTRWREKALGRGLALLYPHA